MDPINNDRLDYNGHNAFYNECVEIRDEIIEKVKEQARRLINPLRTETEIFIAAFELVGEGKKDLKDRINTKFQHPKYWGKKGFIVTTNWFFSSTLRDEIKTILAGKEVVKPNEDPLEDSFSSEGELVSDSEIEEELHSKKSF